MSGLKISLFDKTHHNHQRKWTKQGVALLVLASLAGCETIKPTWDNHSEIIEPIAAQTRAESSPLSSDDSNRTLPDTRPEAMLFPGKAVNRSANSTSHTPTPRFRPKGGDIVLNFADLPIREAARMILSDQLGKDFSIDPEVQGKVSLSNTQGLASSDLVPTLEALLATIDARLVIEGNNYSIVSGAANSLTISQDNLEIIPLRYIDASEFTKLLEGYQVAATPIKRGNLLALNGSSNRIKRVRELARSVDINWLKGMSIGIFPVENTNANTLRDELHELFGKQIDKDNAQALRILAIERSNSIMVIANQNEYVKMMGDWVERLDKVGGASNQAFFVYRVQNGRASDLAKLLDSMFGEGAHPVNEDDKLARTAPRSLAKLNAKNGFSVVADESTNSLIFTGSPHYYKAVRDAMKQLDSTPLQVLVEARIMELTLSDDLQYGLEWFLNGSRASSNTSGILDLGGPGIGAIQPGFSYVVERAGEVRAALNGLADDSRLKVLSSPSLMVLNNRTASILVGDEVPIPTRQAVSNISPDAPTVNEIEYRNTGILLTVSPRVNSGGMVTMDISQEVSSVVNNITSQIDAPTIQQRQLNSTVSIRDGQTVVLGGLIRDQSSNRETGVPVLKEIPGVGKLFSTTENQLQRTELIVLITPRVISNEKDTDAITREYREKMIGLRPIPLSQL